MAVYEFPTEKKESFMFSFENPTGTRNGGSRGGDCSKLSPCVVCHPGETLILCDTDGPGMLTHFWFGGNQGHNSILRIYWDNNPFPSVEVPISAFFGYAYDENIVDRDGDFIHLNSEYVMLTGCKSCNCFWNMPFHKHCLVTLENVGSDNSRVYYSITGWHGRLSSSAGYFHATYRQEHPVTRGLTYEVLNVTGRGRYMGMFLAVGVNGEDECWCEGEAKAYIDGDIYPTLNYTGTEDYFGGSYNFGKDSAPFRYQTFSARFMGLYAITGDMNEQNNQQKRFLLYRWHGEDAIWFENSFRMTLDNRNSTPRCDDYASVAFWYQDKPTGVPYPITEETDISMT